MKCLACHFENPAGFAFCGKCGTRLVLTCPNCGTELPPGFAFCGRCGARIEPEAPPALISETDLARLQRYLPAHLLTDLPPAPLWKKEDVIRTQARLKTLLETVITYLPRHLVEIELAPGLAPPTGGAFLDGALLFSDISGFTALSERLNTLGHEGAEQIIALVNHYFSAMLEVLFAHGGDLFKFGGDALLAFFPDQVGGSASALQAAWAMQQAMTAFHQAQTSIGTFPLQMKIGLHAGPIFAARVGSADEREFFVTGPTVNATAKAESLAEAGQILITDVVKNQVSATVVEGPAGHYIVTGAPTAQFPIPNSQFPIPTTDLPSTLDALDRLTPYLPSGLLPRLALDPARHETSGEHRLVAVLFVNFLGASELVTRLGRDRTEQIAHALQSYYVAVHQAIARYEGVINKIDLYHQGDKLTAIFGAPLAHEDDAERAVRAALEILDFGLPVLDPQSKIKNPESKIGISNGLVFAGHVGSAMRREYTVMGDEVNLAARLMSAAQEGEILLSSFVQRKISPFFETADRGLVTLKGKSKPVPTFTIVGRRAQPEPVRGIRGLRSPLVGRAAEEATLQRLTGELCTGRGNILSLIGEAGLGKSRLIAELRQRIAPSGPQPSPLQAEGTSAGQGEITWLEGHCLSYTQQVSYSAFTDVMRSALGIAETDNEFDIRIKLHQRVEALLPGEAATDILPYLTHFFGLSLSGPAAERVAYLDGEALQRQVVRSVAAFLEQMARQRPLVLAFDDLHWADSASLTLLERCLALTDRVPVLILLIYRPDRAHGCWALGQTAARDYPHCYTEIQLRPLDREAQQDEELVRNLLSLERLPPALAELVGRAEGNPFYVEEIIRTLIDQGAIAQENSRWQLTRHVDVRTVPDTLQGIIMARLDRLMEEARRTLQLASVIGRTFRHQVLAWLASAAALAAQLDGSLAALQRAELIRERMRIPDLEFAFKHILIRDVAYESLLVRDRQTFHRLVAQHLEELYTGPKQEEIYELLAHHYSLSEDREKALTYLIKAGDKTRAAYANPEAIAFYRQAEPLAETLDRRQEQATIAASLGDVLFHIGEYDEALDCYQRALCCCTSLTQEADLHRRIGMVHDKRGDFEAALTSFGRGIELLPRAPNTADAPLAGVELVSARLLTARCRTHWQQSQFEAALADGQSSLSYLKGTTYYREKAQAHNELGNTYIRYSRPNEAIAHFEQGLSILEHIGDEHGAAGVYNNLAIIYYQTDLARSMAYFARFLDTMQRLGNVWGESQALQNLGITYFARGDYDQAIDHYRRSLAIKERLRDSLGIADCHINLGEVYRAQGDPKQAIVHLEQALSIAQEIGASDAEAECHRQLAQCCLETGDPESALWACAEALTHAQKIGDRKEEGIVYGVIGNIHLQSGDPTAALIHLEQSATILRQLNREFDLVQVLYDYGRALAELGHTAQGREQWSAALELAERLDLPQEKARIQTALDQSS